jgi:urease accessory protein
MNKFKNSQFLPFNKVLYKAVGVTVAIAVLLLAATPAFAHHPMNGKMASNFFEGFLSGIAHPLIGLDHFATIVTLGLLAAIKRQGQIVPISFIGAAMLGTGAHLVSVSLPGVELFVSGSLLLFGILLVAKDSVNTFAISGLAALAGIFHGYAYGEAIFGAETTPLVAYLIGFTVIQLVVSSIACWIGKATLLKQKAEQQSQLHLRSAGLVISGIGLAFFASQVLAVLLPAPKV